MIAHPERSSFGLVFVHQCRSQACALDDCCLCQHNPNRRCTSNFAGKYLVDDTLQPKCEAPIQVLLINTTTGHPVPPHHAPPHLTCRATLLDGVAYRAQQGPVANPEPFSITLNKQGQPLLITRSASRKDVVVAAEYVEFQLNHGRGDLPLLTTSASSEAMLHGRKPPFCLWVRVVDEASETAPTKDTRTAGHHDVVLRGHVGGGSHRGALSAASITVAVSEPFVVATRRVKSATKLDIPCTTDPVGKLHHVGRESVRRLADLHTAALQHGVPLPPGVVKSVHTVGDFQLLCAQVEGNEALLQGLLSVVKLCRPKWLELCAHASMAVLPDNRHRVWEGKDGVALLYACRRGYIAMECPAALFERVGDVLGGKDVLGDEIEAQHTAQHSMQHSTQRYKARSPNAWGVAERMCVEAAHQQACQRWKQAGHPGWKVLEDASVVVWEDGGWQGEVERGAACAAESPCTGKTTKTTTKPTTHTSPRDDHHTTPHTSPFTSATPPPMPWLMPPPPTIPIPPPLTDQFMDTSPCFSPAAKRSRTPPPDPRGAPYKRRSMRLDGEDGVLQERVPLYKASPKYQASPTYKASPGQEVLLPPTHHSSHAHNDDVYGDGAYGGECDVMGEVSLWLQGRSVLDGCEQDHMATTTPHPTTTLRVLHTRDDAATLASHQQPMLHTTSGHAPGNAGAEPTQPLSSLHSSAVLPSLSLEDMLRMDDLGEPSFTHQYVQHPLSEHQQQPPPSPQEQRQERDAHKSVPTHNPTPLTFPACTTTTSQSPFAATAACSDDTWQWLKQQGPGTGPHMSPLPCTPSRNPHAGGDATPASSTTCLTPTHSGFLGHVLHSPSKSVGRTGALAMWGSPSLGQHVARLHLGSED